MNNHAGTRDIKLAEETGGHPIHALILLDLTELNCILYLTLQSLLQEGLTCGLSTLTLH